MGKKIRIILAVAFILSLAGCGNQGNAEKAAEVNPVVQVNDNRLEKPENGDAQEIEENVEQENTLEEQGLLYLLLPIQNIPGHCFTVQTIYKGIAVLDVIIIETCKKSTSNLHYNDVLP